MSQMTWLTFFLLVTLLLFVAGGEDDFLWWWLTIAAFRLRATGDGDCDRGEWLDWSESLRGISWSVTSWSIPELKLWSSSRVPSSSNSEESEFGAWSASVGGNNSVDFCCKRGCCCSLVSLDDDFLLPRDLWFEWGDCGDNSSDSSRSWNIFLGALFLFDDMVMMVVLLPLDRSMMMMKV